MSAVSPSDIEGAIREAFGTDIFHLEIKDQSEAGCGAKFAVLLVSDVRPFTHEEASKRVTVCRPSKKRLLCKDTRLVCHTCVNASGCPFIIPSCSK